MSIVEILAGLNKSGQKDYILKQLLTMNGEERKKFIESIVDINLLLLTEEQCKRAEFVESLRKNGIESSIVNSDVYPNYLSVLRNYKDLAEELLLVNPIELSILFSYLLWYGYFSINKKNAYKNDNILLPCHLYPYTIMDGWGTCLNHSIVLADYLNVCGVEAASLKTDIKQHNVKASYIPPIEQVNLEPKKRITLTSLFAKKHGNNGNHVFTLIKEDEYFYIFDATNLMMFTMKNRTKAKCLVANINTTLYPILSYELIDNDTACKTLDNFITTSGFTECPYQIDYFKFITEQSLETIINNLRLIDDCYDESHEDIAKIARYVKERKVRLPRF